MAIKFYRYAHEVQGKGLVYSGDIKATSKKQALRIAKVKLFSQVKREVPEQLIQIEEIK